MCISLAKNLSSSDYWQLHWIIRLEVMWLNYWDEVTDRIAKCLSDVLMSYKWEIEFCYSCTKIRDLTRNLQQNHSSFWDTINMWTIKLFAFSNLVPRVSWLSDREGGTFFHIKNPTCSGNELVYLLQYENWIAVANASFTPKKKLRLH